MIYLSHELALLQNEAQRYEALAAQLNADAAQQDQIAVAATNRATAARNEASRLSGIAANYQTQANTADAQAANLDQQIANHRMYEPEQMIENPNPRGKPPYVPNPEWGTWNEALIDLIAERDQARAAATSARASADQHSAAAAQQGVIASAADREAADAVASAAQLRRDAVAAVAEKDAVTRLMPPLVRWQQELARQPLDRNALETTERELTARIELLDSLYAATLDTAAAADKRQWYLQTLTLDLNAKITSLDAQRVQATTEETNARAVVADLQRRISNVMQRKPE